VTGFQFDSFIYDFPSNKEPDWKDKVERWYQLDAASYGLCEALTVWNESSPPEALLLASPGASNLMDRQFVESGANSPSKFVYTLPNVRSAAVCQLLAWHGPLFCLQKDPATLVTALQLAPYWLTKYQSLWILGVVSKEKPSMFLAYRFVLNADSQGKLTSSFENLSQMSDTDLLFKLLKNTGNKNLS
jgi:hypothetical protein